MPFTDTSRTGFTYWTQIDFACGLVGVTRAGRPIGGHVKCCRRRCGLPEVPVVRPPPVTCPVDSSRPCKHLHLPRTLLSSPRSQGIKSTERKLVSPVTGIKVLLGRASQYLISRNGLLNKSLTSSFYVFVSHRSVCTVSNHWPFRPFWDTPLRREKDIEKGFKI